MDFAASVISTRRREFQDSPNKSKQYVAYWAAITPVALIAEWAAKERKDADAKWRERYEHRWKCLGSLFEKRGARYGRCRWTNFKITCPTQRTVVDGLREWCKTLPKRVKRGENLILMGPCGSGKDHLLACIWREAILRHGIYKGEWVTGPTMFNAWRKPPDKDARPIHFGWGVCHGLDDVLAISDPVPPGGTLTAYEASLMFSCIDERSSDGKSTWVTVNAASREDIEQRLGPGSVDRLRDRATVVVCNWPSYRTPMERIG